jgi:uncharacterized MAPEG superfamily protein
MLIPFICVLVGSLLPYVWGIVDDLERKKSHGGRDNNHPRVQAVKLEGRAARAGGASANAFEGFPIFAAAVLMSAFAGVEGAFVTIACLVWVVVRFVHGLAYLADKPGLRGPMFGLGAITNLVLMGNVIRVLAG